MTREKADVLEENAQLKEQVKQLQECCNRRQDIIYNDMLLWRDIDREMGDVPCSVCGGAGVRAYGDTSLWGGGAGGQMVTSGICDMCWGSRKANKPWTNLRKLKEKLEKQEKEVLNFSKDRLIP